MSKEVLIDVALNKCIYRRSNKAISEKLIGHPIHCSICLH